MKKRNWPLVIAIVAALGVAAWLWLRSDASEPAKKEVAQKLAPEVRLQSMVIKNYSNQRIYMENTVVITNKLPVELKTHRVTYTLYIDSIKVIDDEYNKPIVLGPNDSIEITIPTEIKAEAMNKVFRQVESRDVDSSVYSLFATIHADVPVQGEKAFDLQTSEKQPALRLPVIKVEDIDLNALKLKKEGVDVLLSIYNPAYYPMDMKDCTYSLISESGLKLEGALQGMVKLPARGTETVSSTTKLKDGNLLSVGWDALTNQKDPYTFTFRYITVSPNKMMDNSEMVFTLTGTLDELLKTAKGKP